MMVSLRRALALSVLVTTLAFTPEARAGEPAGEPASAPLTTRVEVVHTLQQAANKLEQERRFGEAAARWLELVRSPAAASDPSLRELAFFRAQKDLREAFRCGGDARALCTAHAAIDDYLEDVLVDASTAAELRAEQHELRDMLVAELHRSGRNPCGPEEPGPLVGGDAPLEPTMTPAREGPAAPPSPSAVGKVDAGRDPTPLLVAGGVTTGVGAVLLGVMAYGLARMNRVEQQSFALLESATLERRPFTASEREAMDALAAEYGAEKTLALTTGITGALATVGGVTLLVIGGKQRARQLAVTPRLEPTAAGLAVSGRF
ncbi:MAG: hypothetical protein H6713_31330 [Myxococcales bacterium]|nr:hypothetical protein [Myxococcales bacterium]